MSSAEDVRKDWATPVPKRPRCSNTSCRKPCKPSESVQDGAGLTYCSTSCGIAKEDGLSQAALRVAVTLRDKGVCVLCGQDCHSLRCELDALRTMLCSSCGACEYDAAGEDGACSCGDGDWFDCPKRARQFEARVHQLVRLGWDEHSITSGAALFEIDHTTPTVLGGASTVANARLLCRPCHKKATKGLAKSRAASRRPFRRDR